MTHPSIPPALRRRISAEARNRCAYCHSFTEITGAKPVIDHIIPTVAGGLTEPENLCLACHACNEFKGAQVVATDPLTGELAPLFHPRQQRWKEHFRWGPDGTEITGRTAVGRATVAALNLNHPLIVEACRRWVAVGWHPPSEDIA